MQYDFFFFFFFNETRCDEIKFAILLFSDLYANRGPRISRFLGRIMTQGNLNKTWLELQYVMFFSFFSLNENTTWRKKTCDYSSFQISMRIVNLKCLDFCSESRLREFQIKQATIGIWNMQVFLPFLKWKYDMITWDMSLLGFQISMRIVD